jgi:hypothetical protein
MAVVIGITLLPLTFSSTVITPAVFGQTPSTTTVHTFDSKLHGLRVHYSDGW